MKEYTLNKFCIDLIAEEYETSDPNEIHHLIKKDLYEEISVCEIAAYLNNPMEDFEKESRTIKLKDIF